ncbi:ATP-binding cassette domain-containing protein [Helicobacter cynogastricus]|uniref:hypothetical protein n=1 Tax=Helicobacter cynogastricus TaxID=329937 RepID=UPI000CF1C45C|nr:hypothetical protein [Helicobacter cynogastricus]
METLEKRRAFYKQAQMVFQDPISGVNPTLNVFEALAEPLVNPLNIADTELSLRIERACEMFHIAKNTSTNTRFC